jgi:hypothetical protein
MEPDDDLGPARPNRRQRRRAKALQRRSLARADLIRLAAALAEIDSTVSGATIIMPSGEIEHLPADRLRSGGQA